MVDFKVQAFLDCAGELLRADETDRALWVLNNLPAYYRDHVPGLVVEMKNEIYKRISTPSRYAESQFEIDVIDFKNANDMGGSLRGLLIDKDVAWFNSQGLVPHIVDCGPGEFWLPITLKNNKRAFTYDPIALNQRALKIVEPYIKEHLCSQIEGQPSIFVACEIIEHLWNEVDLKTDMMRKMGFADIAHFSTPRYTFDTDCKDWKEKEIIGHLRAYTPTEFFTVVRSLFPEYEPYLYDSQIMHLRLTHERTKVPGLLERAHHDFDKL